MTWLELATRNATGSRLRALMTVLAVAICVLAFVALRTALDAWQQSSRYAQADRLFTRNRLSMVSPLPLHYVELARRVPGVRAVSHCDWFGARWPKAPDQFFANLACAANVFDLYPEVAIDPIALARFKQDRQAAILGDQLAKQLKIRVGDEIPLESSLYPGDFRVHVVGIYSAPPRSAVDRSSFFFRWEYKNDAMPPARRDLVSWIFTRVDDPRRGAAVSRAIDRQFEDGDARTLTMSERAANQANLGAMSAVLRALDVVSLILLLILGLVLGNTLAMNVRERSNEFAVLRALGFSSRQIAWLIVGEALALAVAAWALGLALSYPIVELAMGRWLEENAGKFFPSFRLSGENALISGALCLLLAFGAAVLPARGAVRQSVAQALRRID